MKSEDLTKIYTDRTDKELHKCSVILGITYAELKTRVGCLFDQNKPQHREFWLDGELPTQRLLFVVDTVFELLPAKMGEVPVSKMHLKVTNLVFSK